MNTETSSALLENSPQNSATTSPQECDKNTFQLIDKTLGDVLDETVAKFPKRNAFIYPETNTRMTWEEFAHSVDTLAKGLMYLGVEKGEKIAIWAPNVEYWVTLMFASAKIGAILVTVNTNYRSNELSYLLQQSHCENLFLVENFREHNFIASFEAIAPEVKNQEPAHISIENLPHLKRVVNLGQNPQKGMFQIADIFAMAKHVSDAQYEARKALISFDDIVNMQYTSGTTGFPKGVMLTHISISNNGYWIGERQKLSEKDILCLPVPLFHCFGCVLGVLACLHHGTCMVILESFNPIHAMNAIQNEKCTAFYAVPSMYLAMVEHRNFKNYDFSSLRTGIMSGAICPEPLMRRVLDEMNMKEITIPYGLTENSPVMSMTSTEENIEDRCATVGPAMPGIEIIIRDPDTGVILPPHKTGEICCRGYSVMKGYYDDEKATQEVIDAEGWLSSGDLGIMDERGYLRITGRIKDMIVRGGENIYPREIEEFLLKMPKVQDVQVVAIPSLRYGEDVAAFIIPKAGETVLPEEVREFSKGQIAWHKVPRYIACLEAYPLTASGKIQKYKLRELALSMFDIKT